jgi:glycosyltransferase involved in cell wall biosynthesis
MDDMTTETKSYIPLEKPTKITEQHWPEGTVPLVSITCITYNHVNFIRDAIEGFLMQETTFPVEILIHDDASTDGTAEIVSEYEAKYPKLIKPVYQNENQYSQGKKPSQFLHAMTLGKYIAACEGDDYWTDPCKLQKQADFLKENNEYVICFHDSLMVGAEGKMIARSKLGAQGKRDYTSDELKRAPNIPTQTRMFRREAMLFPPEGGFAFGGDKFGASMLGNYGKAKFLGNVWPSVFRVHDGGVNRGIKSDGVKLVQLLRTRIALFMYYDRVGDKEVADYFVGQVAGMCARARRKHSRITTLGKRVLQAFVRKRY